MKVHVVVSICIIICGELILVIQKITFTLFKTICKVRKSSSIFSLECICLKIVYWDILLFWNLTVVKQTTRINLRFILCFYWINSGGFCKWIKIKISKGIIFRLFWTLTDGKTFKLGKRVIWFFWKLLHRIWLCSLILSQPYLVKTSVINS